MIHMSMFLTSHILSETFENAFRKLHILQLFEGGRSAIVSYVIRQSQIVYSTCQQVRFLWLKRCCPFDQWLTVRVICAVMFKSEMCVTFKAHASGKACQGYVSRFDSAT